MSDADTYREIWSLIDADPAVSKAQTPEEWKAALSAALDALIADPHVAISTTGEDCGTNQDPCTENKVPGLVTS